MSINKNVKAFTLIKLLVIIVILAIITLIILGIINNAKEKAFKTSLKNVEHIYELYVAKHQGNADFDTSKEIDIKELSLDSKNLKGVVFTNVEGKIELKNITNGTYCANGTKNNLTITKGKCEEIPQIITLEPKPDDVAGFLKIIYYDPVNDTTCYKSQAASTTGTKTGCMKWYAYLEDDTTYTAILDHNTTARVAYNSLEDYDWDTEPEVTPKEIQVELDNLTKSVADGGSGWKVTPRLITGQEVADITGKTSFNAGGTDVSFAGLSTTSSKYYWLLDYTDRCTSYGCKIADSATRGYWTSTPFSSIYTHVSFWHVGHYGRLSSNSASVTNYGLRPVITISKSKL